MSSARYMTEAEVEVDLARLSEASHRHMTVIQAPGGWRLRCLNCKIEGERLYQERGTAMAVSFELALDSARPPCKHAQSPITGDPA